MYANYEKLWNLIAKKDLKKTELAEAAGLSSRTLAKLSANESVTTDTLGRICEVLGCDISDIMCFSKEPLIASVYDAYKKYGRMVEETEYVKTYEFEYGGVNYRVSVTKDRADSHTVVRCEKRNIVWEQYSKLPRLYGGGFINNVKLPYGDDHFNAPGIAEVKPIKGIITLFVISGKPGSIEGLDDGIFRSARNFGGDKFVHVMSMTAFKLFTGAQP